MAKRVGKEALLLDETYNAAAALFLVLGKKTRQDIACVVSVKKQIIRPTRVL